MNLYLITQADNNDYDTFDAFVVAAETEEEARNFHPGTGLRPDPWGYEYSCWSRSPKLVTVKLLGTAAPGISAGRVLGSFNAG